MAAVLVQSRVQGRVLRLEKGQRCRTDRSHSTISPGRVVDRTETTLLRLYTNEGYPVVSSATAFGNKVTLASRRQKSTSHHDHYERL